MRSSRLRRVSRPKFRAARKFLVAVLVMGSAGLTASLTGCITGDGTAGEFGRLLAEYPVVEEFELSSADNMPFTGGVSGVVKLSDDTSDAQLRDLSEGIVEFAADDELQTEDHTANQPSRVRVDLDFDGWRFPVLTAPESQQALLDVILDQRSDASIVSGAVSSRAYREDVTYVALQLTDAADAFAALDAASARYSEASMNPVVEADGSMAGEVSIELVGRSGPWLALAQQSYDAVGARVPLSVFAADAERISVTVGDERDAPLAASVVKAELGGSGITVFVQSELLALSPGATGEAARAVFATLDPAVVSSVESAWTDDRALQLRIDTIGNVDAVVDSLAQNAKSATLESIRITVGPPDDPEFSIEAPATELPRALREAQRNTD